MMLELFFIPLQWFYMKVNELQQYYAQLHAAGYPSYSTGY
jgi:hypothetical protein